MKKLFPYITFTCLTIIAVNSGLPLMAGGCRSNSNKSTEIKCDRNDTECQIKKNEEFSQKQVIQS